MDNVIKSVDPVTFEIISHRLVQIAKEMGTTLERVGGTSNTTQQHDYVAALYRANGDVLSAGESVLGWQYVHVACAGFAVRRIIERFGRDDIHTDDMFLLNDPYLAAIHQSDLYLVSPIHYKEQLIGWSATFVHVMDIGAMSPGGNSPGATEICHEGLRIPGIKLVERGKLRRDVFDTLINMTRQPVMVGLDLKCEIAANNIAKSRMQEMFTRYGPELVDAVSSEMIRYSESILRKRITEVHDGTWSETTAIQADETWRMTVTLKKKGDQLLFDFTGTDKQAKRGINLPYHATFGSCFGAVVSTLGYDLPKNHGAFRPIEVIVPEGTLLHVQYPAPVSLNTTSGLIKANYLTYSVMMQMLATSDTWRKEIMALNSGGRNARHAGINQYGRYYVSNLSLGSIGGTGARSYKDGIDSGAGLSCPNVEWTELNFPIFYLFRRHVPDSGGAGKFRGGVGAETALTLHDAPEGKIKGVAMGVAGLRNSGEGLFGGYPGGAPAVLVLVEGTRLGDFLDHNKLPLNVKELDGRARFLPYCEFELKKNDVFYMRLQSGGGYGDPLERDPRAVLNDVINQLVSKEAARDVYGVVIDGEGRKVDLAVTEVLRARLRKERVSEAR